MKIDLIEFHEKFRNELPEVKVAALQEIQTRRYEFRKRIPLKIRRERFVTNPRNRRFLKRDCWVCGDASDVRHHVIALKQGGTNAKRNIVALCAPHHAEIHPWLKAA